MSITVDEPTTPRPEEAGGFTPSQPHLDFDGRYRVERVGDRWHLRGPAFTAGGGAGMSIGGDGPELLAKYLDLADLLNAVVDAERGRSGRR